MAPSAPKAMIISSLDGAHFVDPGVFDQAIVGENFFLWMRYLSNNTPTHLSHEVSRSLFGLFKHNA